jgi:hypothetical protein
LKLLGFSVAKIRCKLLPLCLLARPLPQGVVEIAQADVVHLREAATGVEIGEVEVHRAVFAATPKRFERP